MCLSKYSRNPNFYCSYGRSFSLRQRFVIVGVVFVICCFPCCIEATVASNQSNYCTTPHCIEKAEHILNRMNATANPCTDFFNFACGVWTEKQPPVLRDAELSIMREMQVETYKKLGAIISKVRNSQNMSLNHSTDNSEDVAYAGIKAIKTYDACLKIFLDTSERRFVPFMNSFGGWPMVEENWRNDRFNIETKLDSVIGDFDVAPLFKVDVMTDPFNSTRNILVISPPDIRRIYPIITYFDSLEYVAKVARGGLINETEADEVFNITLDIVKLTTLTRGDVVLTKVGNLSTLLTGMDIDWEKLHQLLLERGEQNVDSGTVSEVQVLLYEEHVINSILSLASSYSSRAINNYFALNVVLNHRILLNGDIVKSTNLNQSCLDVVSHYLTYALDHVFVHNQRISTTTAWELIHSINASFTQGMMERDWLCGSTERELSEKLAEMRYFLDYPGWLADKEQVDEYYNDYDYIDSNPVAAYFNMVKYAVRKKLATYKEINERDKWPRKIPVTKVGASYYQFENNVFLPRAILQPPFLEEEDPKYLTFGSLGMIIGHEITHGFGPAGRYRDKSGKLSEIWNSSSDLKYLELSECFVQQYDNYTINQKRQATVNGVASLGENIADNGGLRNAYRGYYYWLQLYNRNIKEPLLPGLGQYTQEQMFFISFGQAFCSVAGETFLMLQKASDQHAPNYFRVIGSVSNMEEFAEAFNCPQESPMNPSKKCVLW